jgi:putative transcription antitermination factor YqgF
MNKAVSEIKKRIIGLDFGSKRIGVALSDELGLLAFPLCVVPGFGHDTDKREERMSQTEKEVLSILKEKEIDTVIIGHSVDLKGFDNTIMTDARIFGSKLESYGFKIVYEPELFSTVQATKIQGENKNADASAAAIILQSYLDRIKFKNMNTQSQDLGTSSDNLNNTESTEAPKGESKSEVKSTPEYITIDDFIKVEIKIGEIMTAETVEGSDKLLKLSVDFGEEKPRQVLSGIAKYVEIEELIGKKFPFVTNLAPRKMMGQESQAMILAGSHENDLALLNPSKDLPNGTKLK